MRKDVLAAIYMAKKQGMKVNYSKVARQYNCDARTVKRYYEGKEEEVKERAKRKIEKLLDNYEGIIKEKYIENNAPAIAIYNLLKERYGYKGSYSTIKAYTHQLKEQRIKEATVRFETLPGEQGQIDWKEEISLISRSGKEYKVNIFLGILGYSRYRYIELTLDRSQGTLFRCLYNMFTYYGGVPKELLFDNMRTVVDQSRTQFGKPVYNKKFYAFSKDAGFKPISCVAYRPRTKGKVEVCAKLMNRLKAYNREFDSLEEINALVRELNVQINKEVHKGITDVPKERYKKEKEYLLELPNSPVLEPYFNELPQTRKVAKDSLITVGKIKYSVPPNYIGKIVELEVEDNKLKIRYKGSLIAEHKMNKTSLINYREEDYITLLSYSIRQEKDIQEIAKRNLAILDSIN